MRVAVFSAKPYDIEALSAANVGHDHELVFLEAGLSVATAPLSAGCDAVCLFVSDEADHEVLALLAEHGIRLIALRSAGFNNVDLDAAARLDLPVVRVPEYSPHAVAEHCLGLILCLNRKIHRAYNRVRENNFSLVGLLGADLHGKTIGIIGTGNIGTVLATICSGLGMRVLAHDPRPNADCRRLGVIYRPLDDVLAAADIVSLHCPLTPDTHHLIDQNTLGRMRDGVMLINTSRGGLVDTGAVIEALKSGKVGQLGLDVYEEESTLFFEDLSQNVIADDVFSRLLTFPNVLITGHQGFFTAEALAAIATTTIGNLDAFAAGRPLTNRVAAEAIESG